MPHALRPPHHRHGLGRHGGGRVRLHARGEGRRRRTRSSRRRLPVDRLRAVQGAARLREGGVHDPPRRRLRPGGGRPARRHEPGVGADEGHPGADRGHRRQSRALRGAGRRRARGRRPPHLGDDRAGGRAAHDALRAAGDRQPSGAAGDRRAGGRRAADEREHLRLRPGAEEHRDDRRRPDLRRARAGPRPPGRARHAPAARAARAAARGARARRAARRRAERRRRRG